MDKTKIFGGIAIGLATILCVGIASAAVRIADKPQDDSSSIIDTPIISEYIETENAPGLGFVLLKDNTYGVFATAECPSEVTVPDTVEGIEVTEVLPNAFMDRSRALSKIMLPDTIKVIGDYAFSGIQTLTEINLPKKLEYIGDWAFSSSMVKEFIFPETLKKVGSHAFDRAHVEKVDMGSVEEVSNSAFFMCKYLRSVRLSSKMQEVTSQMFSNSALAEVEIPEGIKVIGSEAFAYTGLKKVTIPNSVVLIGFCAFAGCSSLTEVTLGKSIKHIWGRAFDSCVVTTIYNLSELTLTKGNTDGHGGIAAHATNIYTELPAA